jgi:putative hydrolase of the HAD superfamily
MRYPVVLFDVGETLIGPRSTFGAVYSGVLERLGLSLPADRLESSLRGVWAEMDRSIPAGADRYAHFPGGETEYWRRFARSTLERARGGTVEESLLDKLLDGLRAAFRGKAAWTVYPDVLPVLGELRSEGVRLGVVSNWDSRLPRLLDELGLSPFFDAIGVSHLEGVEKPDPELFHRVLERMDGRANDALHVGDIPEVDLAGARAAGVDGILIDRRGKLDGGEPAISDLTRLPRIARGEMTLREAIGDRDSSQ